MEARGARVTRVRAGGITTDYTDYTDKEVAGRDPDSESGSRPVLDASARRPYPFPSASICVHLRA